MVTADFTFVYSFENSYLDIIDCWNNRHGLVGPSLPVNFACPGTKMGPSFRLVSNRIVKVQKRL